MALTQRGRTGEAIDHFQQALAVKPDLAVAHYYLGAISAGRGQIEVAIGHYNEALKINRDIAEVHYQLAAILAGRGRTDEATAHYREALDIARQQNKAALVQKSRGAAVAQWGRAGPVVELRVVAAKGVRPGLGISGQSVR